MECAPPAMTLDDIQASLRGSVFVLVFVKTGGLRLRIAYNCGVQAHNSV